jgi:Tol biopolymer transport system component
VRDSPLIRSDLVHELVEGIAAQVAAGAFEPVSDLLFLIGHSSFRLDQTTYYPGGPCKVHVVMNALTEWQFVPRNAHGDLICPSMPAAAAQRLRGHTLFERAFPEVIVSKWISPGLIAAAALIGLGCQSEPTHPAVPSPLVNRVVFRNFDPNVGSDLFHVSVDGGEPVHLTEGAQGNGCPSVSPDGATIVFTNASIMAMDSDGSNVRELAPSLPRSEAVFGCASWSPDGTRLTVVRRVDRIKSSGTSDLFVLKADGSEVTLIASGDKFYQVRWAPSGDRILFSSSSYTDGGPYDFAFNVINSDGSGRERSAQRWSGADWSPDAERVAFVCGEGNVNALCVSQPNGAGMVSLTPPGMLVRTPDWAPVGNTIAFACAPAVCTVNADGSELRTVAHNGSEPVWSPDASLIVYSCGPNPTLCAVRSDGSGNRTLVALPGTNALPSFSPLH